MGGGAVALQAFSSAYSIFSAEKAKKATRQAGKLSRRQANINARLESARVRRANRASAAKSITSLNAAGVSGSVSDSLIIGNLTATARELRSIELQRQSVQIAESNTQDIRQARIREQQVGAATDFGQSLIKYSNSQRNQEIQSQSQSDTPADFDFLGDDIYA